MADVNAPSRQTPTMAPPVRANDQILPHIRWVPIGKSNCYLDLEKTQSNPIYKITVDLLKNTNFFRAFIASFTIPSIYIQQFWDTILYDKKAGCYKCQLDEQWFDLAKETLREALQITPVNHNQAFAAPLSIDGLIDFVNQLGYPKLVMNLSNILWDIVTRTNIDYAERIWEEFTQFINTFIEDKRNLSRHTSGKKRATLIVIPSIRFTKLIIHHLQRKHRFHPRPDSPLHLSNEEPVLGYLKFSAKGTKNEVFGMPIPDSLITVEIQHATYYREYLAKVTHHRKYMAGETGGVQNPPASKPTQPARKPKAPTRPSISIPVASTQPAPISAPAKSHENKRKQATKTTDKPAKAKRIKHSISRKTRQPRSSPKSVGASEAEEVLVKEPQVADEDANYQKAVEESMKDAYALSKGSLPPVVIRELESGKYQPLPEVPGKGKAKVTEEQSDNEEESEKVMLGAEEGGQDEGQAGPNPGAQAKDQTGSDAGAQADGQAGSNPDETSKSQAGSNPDETSKGQAGPDPGDAEAKVQSISSPVVHAGSDREHMDLDVANVSPQPSTEQLDDGFTATVYPNVQDNLKLAVEEPVLLEEPASSSGTLSSLQNLIESMVNVTIQQAMSSISLMTSSIIDLTSRPESPKEHQQLKATTTDTTTTTTTLPPSQAPQQSTIEAVMVKRIGELEHILTDLIQVNKNMEERLDKHGARLYTLEQLDIPQQMSIAVSEVVTDAVDWAMQAPLRNRFRDLPEADMKEILHQRMWESDSYKSHEDHMQLFEALEKSMNRDHSEELAQDLAEACKKKKKSHESPKTPPGSPSHQPPPPPPPAGPSGASGDPRASGSAQMPPSPPPTSSTNQESPYKGSAAPNIGSAHIPTVNLRQGWWKPFEEERPTTPEPAWSICSSDVPTSDIATFIDWFCKRRGITELKPQDLEGPAYEIVKVFHPDQTTTTGGSPGQVTIQSEFFFNKDLEYLRYGSKGRRPALSISKMKAAYYPDAGLERMVPDQF
uniref:Monodehydroascorbate reductase n=1 Tax=Tanacetum cinerariifolium TaxID=118510 RepID=A0A6L2KVN5_TANCI|nr:monodehydroascorbate reductase [Tanacetum cinerariifolium]